MLDLGVTAIVFGLIFVGELPDKSAIATLVLSTRFPWKWVFVGVATAFLVHVVIAVAAGSLITLLPHDVVEIVVTVLFLVGAVLIWREGMETEEEREAEEEHELEDELAGVPTTAGFGRVASLGFATIFVAEWGDLTQIMTANLAAKYDHPVSVAVGAALGLWSVALLAILGGNALLRVLPMQWICRVAAVVMLGLAIYTGLGVAGVI
ncbi:TMEM165/GDT1 family protein [Nocardioides panacisoli]|uniref:GDT1 family protein n=1 Tax=Nocardioides panacisoli TaxID=627624 RepID=A0ABP7ICA6_9ACTN